MTDCAIFTLCLLAAMSAECIPLMLILTAAAGVVTIRRMAYYRECPWCGAHLDPGERCDCQDKKKSCPVLPTPNSSGWNRKAANSTVSPLVYRKTKGSSSMIDKMLQATFVIKITDDQYSALNLLPGDMVLCDEETNEGPLLICVWDDAAHICLRTGYGALFDCGSHRLAPSEAVVYGRPLIVTRDICVGEEATA